MYKHFCIRILTSVLSKALESSTVTDNIILITFILLLKSSSIFKSEVVVICFDGLTDIYYVTLS